MPQAKPGSYHGNKLHVKKGDKVIVTRGKHKGAMGEVVFANAESQKVIVEGVNIVKKHVKSNSAAGLQGGIKEMEAAMHASKVRLLDPETGKPTRVRKQIVDGKKVRIGVKSGKAID